MRTAATGILLALLATASPAQEKLFESVEVHVMGVDVVVTDRDGHPVTGLTKDDFEIYQGGERQIITNFSEYRGEWRGPESQGQGAPFTAVEPPPRRFLLFIDNSSIDASARKPVFDALRRFVATQFRAGDEGGVVAFDGTLRLVVPMTADRSAVAAAIDAIAAAPSPTTAFTGFLRVRSECMRDYGQVIAERLPANVAYQMCTREAQVQTKAEVIRNRRLLDAMRIAVTMIGGLDGKKALIVAGGAAPLRPGFELFSLANRTFAGLLPGLLPPDETRFDDQVREFENLAQHAGSYDVALYFLNATRSTEDSAIQIGVAAPPTGASDFLRIGSTQEGYHLLAEGTGGLAPRGRDVDAALAAIAGTLDSYYSIGYEPSKAPGGDGRTITVKAKNDGYLVHSRRTVAQKSADAQMADRVVANIYAPHATPEWPIEIHLGKPKRAKRNFVIPLEVRIPPTLTLLPNQDKLIAGFTLYVTVGRDSGALSSTFRQPQAFSIRKSEEAEFRARPIPFRTTLTVSPGRNLVSVGVLDMIGNNAGLAQTVLVTP